MYKRIIERTSMRNNRDRKVFVALLLFVFLSESSQVIQITENGANQMDPSVYGDIVVWEDDRNGNYDIYGYNVLGQEEFQITDNVSNQYDPVIYEDYMVWMDERNGNYDIYGYNLKTLEEFQITDNTSSQINPAVYRDYVVWMDERNGNYDIYGYSIVTQEEFQITDNESNQINPAVHNDTVVWQDYRNGNWDIYGYNLLTTQEFQITTDARDQINPAVHNDTVVWQDYRNGNYDIYGYNLTRNQEFQITANRSGQVNPAVHSDTIVWEDDRNGNYDIYGYNLTRNQEFHVEVTPALQRNPAIYEESIVWEDDRNGNYDIYGVMVTATFTVTVTVTDADGNPLSGASVILGSYSGTTDEIGVAVISDIAPGVYTLTVFAPGYQENMQQIQVTEDQFITVTLTSAEPVSEPEPESDFTVTITVQDVSQTPVPQAVVTLTGPVTYIDTTDAQGQVVFLHVVNGVYTLTVSHLNYGTYIDPAFEVNTTMTTTVMLNPGMGFIHGTVYWTTTTTPAKGVRVHIYDEAAGTLEESVTTDFQGRFIAEVVKPKVYSLIVEDFTEQTYVGITPVDSLDTGAVILIIDPECYVKGVVQNESGDALSGAQIVIENTKDQFIIHGTTDSYGEFTIKVIPGVYTVEVTAPEYQSVVQTFAVSYKESYNLGSITVKKKPEQRIDVPDESPPVDSPELPSTSVMIPVLITLSICIAAVVIVVLRAKNRSDLAKTVLISVFTGIIAIIVMWILFQIG